LPIPDRGVPPDQEAARHLLAALRDHLAAGRAVAVHCRIGIGRSSLIAAALLVVHGVPAAEAWMRVEAARGCPVPDTAAQMEWVQRKDER
jgi:protein-tyrosine phosphatase